MNPRFQFKNKLWIWSTAKASWHFVSVPKENYEQIKGFYEGPKRGFGSIRVKAKIGKTSWKTSIFRDKKRNAYLLPIKSEVRKKENIKVDQSIDVLIELI